MAKTIQSKKKGTPEPVNNEEDTPQGNTIPPIVGFVTPLIRYEGTTGESLPLGNQADNLPPSIPNKYSSPPKPLLPLAQGFHLEDPVEDKVGNQAGILLTQIPYESSPTLKPPLPLATVLHPSDPANPYKKKETPDIQTKKSPPLAVLATPVKKMIATPPKANQTAIAILMTINHTFFGFSIANCWRMSGMIGHIGSNARNFGGETFKYFTNLTSTWIPNSPLGGLDLWIVSINHDNDHLDSPFPTHT